MSKLGDDLIQSLKGALAHARDDGPGTEHSPQSPHGSDADDSQGAADSDTDEADE